MCETIIFFIGAYAALLTWFVIRLDNKLIDAEQFNERLQRQLRATLPGAGR